MERRNYGKNWLLLKCKTEAKCVVRLIRFLYKPKRAELNWAGLSRGKSINWNNNSHTLFHQRSCARYSQCHWFNRHWIIYSRLVPSECHIFANGNGVKICCWSSDMVTAYWFYFAPFSRSLRLPNSFKQQKYFWVSCCYWLEQLLDFCFCRSWENSFLIFAWPIQRHDDSPLVKKKPKAQDYFRFHQHFIIQIFSSLHTIYCLQFHSMMMIAQIRMWKRDKNQFLFIENENEYELFVDGSFAP